MTLVASPRTRNLSLSSARAAPGNTRAAAIRSAKLGFMLGFMGETSDICDLDVTSGLTTAPFPWLARGCEREFQHASRRPELLRLFDFVARRYSDQYRRPHHRVFLPLCFATS